MFRFLHLIESSGKLHQPETAEGFEIRRCEFDPYIVASQIKRQKRQKTTNLDINESRKDRSEGGGIGSNLVWVEMQSNHGPENSSQDTASARFSIESTAAADI
jgi:hypothetical protein